MGGEYRFVHDGHGVVHGNALGRHFAQDGSGGGECCRLVILQSDCRSLAMEVHDGIRAARGVDTRLDLACQGLEEVFPSRCLDKRRGRARRIAARGLEPTWPWAAAAFPTMESNEGVD